MSDDDLDGKGAVGGALGDERMKEHAELQLRLEEKRIERIQLELEMARLKQTSATEKDQSDQPKELAAEIMQFSKMLANVLSRIPGEEEMVPGWFDTVESVWKAFKVPKNVQTMVLLPYLSERVRHIARDGETLGFLQYPEVKTKVLELLQLSPNEYRRLFTNAKKKENEPWTQLAERVRGYLDYYVRSRKVENFDDLKELLIADRVKEILSEDAQAFVTLREGDDWLRPAGIAKWAQVYDESNKLKGDSGKRLSKPAERQRLEGNATRGPFPPRKCFVCGSLGHLARSCPESEKKVAARVETVEGEVSGIVKEAKLIELELCGERLPVRLDSGADITVIRKSLLPDRRDQPKGKIKLRGAFGQEIEAELVHIPCRLADTSKVGNQQQKLVLCALTDELASGLNVLLTQTDYEDLKAVWYEELEGDYLGANMERGEEKFFEPPLVRSTEGISNVDEGETPRAGAFCIDSEAYKESGAAETHDSTGKTDSSVEQTLQDSRLRFRKEQREDESLRTLQKYAKARSHGFTEIEGLLFHKESMNKQLVMQVVLPKGRHRQVLQVAHDLPVGGHFSFKKTKQRIKNSFYWPGMDEDIREYCRTCESCQLTARERTKDRVPIQPLTRPQVPFQMVVMDCVGPIDPPSSKGYKYAVCIVDVCTRWPEVICMRSLTAKATCDASLEVFSRMGTPEVISSDQGSNFTAGLTRELMSRLGVSPRFSTPGHPESNGLVERWNQTFKGMLRQWSSGYS
ncbi:uncharacterized protein LOC115313958 [Ixodes scapularis]|uniref:uncharacterized protein LOC115313958 n=1 Tax=Ixodes scapularis TaxID=6945 RepID=UPI001C38E0B4|nr:uncharacterized protein LOC115313958 [Ixodes scapularis]